MNQEIKPRSVLAEVRDLVPHRPLSPGEARSVLERQASRLLTLMDIPGPPVPMEELLAGLPRIAVKRWDNLPTSGRTQWDGGQWVLLVAADEPAVRQRFSLAHELAHVVLHPVSDIALPDHGKTTAEARLETSCEYFAACLLMPRLWMKRAYLRDGYRTYPH